MHGLGLLLVGATVLVRVDLAEDVPIDIAHDIATRFAAEIEAETGHTTVAETRPTGRCADDEAECVADARRRTGADNVLILRLYRAVTTTAIFVRHPGQKPYEGQLSSWPSKWNPVLRKLARQCFQNTLPRLPSVVRTPAFVDEAPTPASPPYAPLIVIGGGIALSAASLGFYLRSRGTINGIEAQVAGATVDGTVVGLSYDSVTSAYDEASSQRTVALGLLTSAAVAFISGAVWWYLIE